MLQERREVGSGTERAKLEFGARVCASARFIIGDALLRYRACQNAAAALRILYISRRGAHEMLQTMAAARPQIASAIRIGIDIESGLALEFSRVQFCPLGRSQE